MSDYNDGLLPEPCLRLDYGFGQQYASVELGDGTGYVRVTDDLRSEHHKMERWYDDELRAALAENAKLRDELANAPKCEACEAMLDCDECLRADGSHKERRRLSAENAKLREALAISVPLPLDDDCCAVHPDDVIGYNVGGTDFFGRVKEMYLTRYPKKGQPVLWVVRAVNEEGKELPHVCWGGRCRAVHKVSAQTYSPEYLETYDENEQLKAENAKLRELVDYMTPIALYEASEQERDRMRELGAEVDDG